MLLRRNIAVVALNAQMSVGGAVLGVLLVALLVLVIYLIRSHKEATKRILISFIKHEVLLAVKISWDLWVRSPERTPCPFSSHEAVDQRKRLQDLGGDRTTRRVLYCQ